MIFLSSVVVAQLSVRLFLFHQAESVKLRFRPHFSPCLFFLALSAGTGPTSHSLLLTQCSLPRHI
jgi:hypothetical protein